MLAPSLVLLALLAAAVWMGCAYRRDLGTHRERLRDASQVIETPGGPIEYTQAGDGPPLLIVHGAGGGFDQGIELGQALADQGFRVIAMSRFGYLRTPLPADPSPAAQADAHASLMDALGIPRAAIFGGSAGAPSAMQFALTHPERCRALVLLVPLAYRPPQTAASAPELSPLMEKVLMTIVGSDVAFWLVSKFARNLVIRTVLATPPGVVRAASKDEQARVERTLRNILPISERSGGILNDARISHSLTREELDKIRAPTLVLSVRDDLYGTFASAEYVAKEIPGAKFVGYDVGGHLWVGHHEQIISEVAAFLRAI